MLELKSAGSAELERYVEIFLRGKYIFPLLALVCVAIPELVTESFDVWPTALGVGLMSIGFFSPLYYQRRLQSARALFLMLDGMMLSFGLLLPFGIFNGARVFAGNYWLYRDYYYVYLVVALATVLLVFIWSSQSEETRLRTRRQMTAFRKFAERGYATAAEFYDALMSGKGAKEYMRGWTTQRYASILAPVSVAFVGLGALGGREYVLYHCFLLSVVIGPLLVAAALQRRFQLWRYLGSRDITILR